MLSELLCCVVRRLGIFTVSQCFETGGGYESSARKAHQVSLFHSELRKRDRGWSQEDTGQNLRLFCGYKEHFLLFNTVTHMTCLHNFRVIIKFISVDPEDQNAVQLTDKSFVILD